jgi:hypothetical protein
MRRTTSRELSVVNDENEITIDAAPSGWIRNWHAMLLVYCWPVGPEARLPVGALYVASPLQGAADRNT